MWKAIHITYYDDQDKLLRDAVQPAIRLMQAQGYIQRAYVFRQWQLAPTLVIHIEVEQYKDYKKAVQLCKTELALYMIVNPSKLRLTGVECQKLAKVWSEDQLPDRVVIHDNHSIHESKLTLPHGLHEQECIRELLHSFYAYTYGLIIHELEQCRDNVQARYYRVARMMAANGGYDLYQSLISGYPTPRARVERYMQRLREREFVSKQYEDADDQFGHIIDHALQDLYDHSNSNGEYVGSDNLLRMWSNARQQLCVAIRTLDESGLIDKDKLDSGITDSVRLTHYIMYTSMKVLLPLFQFDVRQQYMMEYLIIRSLERIECSDSYQLQVSSHR